MPVFGSANLGAFWEWMPLLELRLMHSRPPMQMRSFCESIKNGEVNSQARNLDEFTDNGFVLIRLILAH